jgi:hypothetical protein
MKIGMLVAALIFGLTTAAHTMSISRIVWKGHDAILASGPIQNGDAEKLAGALKELTPAAHGAKILLLDSPGGSVDEALRLAVVPEGRDCASACASIIFISAKYRTIQAGGRIGQHSCSLEGGASLDCNEIIAEHAASVGVAYGSIAAFINYTGPREMLWFDRELADCWGLTRYPFSSRSGYEEVTPCVIKQLSGSYPKAQASWRVDFLGNGFKAFVRGVSDHTRAGQVDLFCNEDYPGRLFFRMHIPGPRRNVEKAIDVTVLSAPPVIERVVLHRVLSTEDNFSLVEASVGEGVVKRFLSEGNEFMFYLEPVARFDPIYARSFLAKSREALIFAANNCIRP